MVQTKHANFLCGTYRTRTRTRTRTVCANSILCVTRPDRLENGVRIGAGGRDTPGGVTKRTVASIREKKSKIKIIAK